MRSKLIPAGRAFAEWQKDPAYVAEFDALADEFALADAMLAARAKADMTQADVAKAMGTTQAVIARLESGKALPSTRTLKRFADATGTRLRIAFEPTAPEQGVAPAARPRPLSGME